MAMKSLTECQPCAGTGRDQGRICKKCRGAGRFPAVVGGYHAIRNFIDGSVAVKTTAGSPWQSIRGQGASDARTYGDAAHFAKTQNKLAVAYHLARSQKARP